MLKIDLQNNVMDFIKSIYQGDICTNNNLGNYTVSYYLPEKCVAIDILCDYTSNCPIDDKILYKKAKYCRDNNIRLVYIWEHEWLNDRQQPILKSIIKAGLGITNRVYARKLKIEVRPSRIMREFFETNNIQGFRGGKLAVCLIDPNTNEVLLSYIIGKGNHMSKGYKYEVIRGASKLGVTVVGGSSKLLKYITSLDDIDEIVYYIDYNYFNGGSLKSDDRWSFKSEQVSFKNYWVAENVVKNREPKKHAEITAKYKTGEIIQLWNAGTATYVYKR